MTLRHLVLAPVLAAGLLVPVAPVAAGCTPLRQGMSGSCVLSLQKRLVALRYDLGTPTGGFGTGTFHAVVAFQKVNGLPRTGVVDATTWSRMFTNPTIPGLRYVRSGSGLEVNVTRQVMYRAYAGRLARIYDVSTGRPSLPTPISNGVPFTIWRKALWGGTGYNDREHYVHYFYPGSLLAIHAYSYVPAYPASHGCVRVPPASAARLWTTTYVGERVYTYR